MRLLLAMLLAAAAGVVAPAAQTGPAAASAAAGPARAQAGRQAVLDTTAGLIVIDLLPEAAPNHVALFTKLVASGAYDGTTFHQAVRYGIIQGGDPLSRDPSKTAAYGSGGFHQVRAESSAERHMAGAVSAVRLPGDPDSGGAQFFICATDQPALDGQYTVFGRVAEGLEVVQAISAMEATSEGRLVPRVEIRRATLRDRPPEPFASDSDADLAAYRVVLETSMGAMTLEMWPDKAPVTVRRFLRMAEAGVYDGVAVHRVVPDFIVQTGAMNFRATPLTSRQQALVGNLPPEFTNTPNETGVVSMARGDAPDSGSTSFFICTARCESLDGQYTAFARVVAGMDVVMAIAAVPVDGETPRTPIALTRARVEKRP